LSKVQLFYDSNTTRPKKLIKQIIPNSSDIAIRIQDLRQNMNKLTNQKGIYEVQMTIAMIIRN